MLLTVAFVLLGEILIYVPSIARFRVTYLAERLATAHLATLALDREHAPAIDRALEEALLEHSGVQAITIRSPSPTLMLGRMSSVDKVFDLTQSGWISAIGGAFSTLVNGGERTIRVIGPAPVEGTNVDIVLSERPMWIAMVDYSWRILALSLVLSLIVAALIIFSLHVMIVQPICSLTEQLANFRLYPEDASIERQPSQRRDEIGMVDREMHEMQHDLRRALMQRRRLAALGEAVSKINHDLKNTLASALLISDRLERSADPEVRLAAPRLLDTIERAIRLCQATLGFAGSQPVEPQLTTVQVAALFDDVTVDFKLANSPITAENRIPPGLSVRADRDQLHRVLTNLVRNATGAMPDGGTIRAQAAVLATGEVVIDISDTGSGIAEHARARLFEPFGSSTRHDGTGLGLAICREIMRSHGGDVELAGTGPGGTTFRLRLPPRALMKAAA